MDTLPLPGDELSFALGKDRTRTGWSDQTGPGKLESRSCFGSSSHRGVRLWNVLTFNGRIAQQNIVSLALFLGFHFQVSRNYLERLLSWTGRRYAKKTGPAGTVCGWTSKLFLLWSEIPSNVLLQAKASGCILEYAGTPRGDRWEANWDKLRYSTAKILSFCLTQLWVDSCFHFFYTAHCTILVFYRLLPGATDHRNHPRPHSLGRKNTRVVVVWIRVWGHGPRVSDVSYLTCIQWGRGSCEEELVALM